MTMAIVLVSFGIVITLVGLVALKRERKIYAEAEVTKATVVGYDKNHGPTVPVLEFTVDADVVKLPLKDYTGEKLAIGDRIEVGYTITTSGGQQYYHIINLESGLPASKPVMTLAVTGAALVLLGFGIAIMSTI